VPEIPRVRLIPVKDPLGAGNTYESHEPEILYCGARCPGDALERTGGGPGTPTIDPSCPPRRTGRETRSRARKEGNLGSQENGDYRLRHVGPALVQIGCGARERAGWADERDAQSGASKRRPSYSCS